MGSSDARALAAPFDPVDLAVLSQRFEAIVRSQANTLVRSGRSVILNTGRDFSCAVVTGGDELLAVAESLPVHVLSGPDLMARSMREFHPDFAPGDAFLHNSPYHGNSHAADLSILVPVFDDEGRHRFTILSKAHQADIGNSEPTGYSATARDVYEEGSVIFPCVKVQQGGRDVEDVIRMCRVRIRVPDQWWGDYLALLGSARVGERNLRALGREVGWDRLDDFVAAWFDYSEMRMAEAISALPARRITVRTCHDPFEQVPDGIPITVHLTVSEDAIDVDLTDNLDCQPCGLNLTESTARSGALLGVFNAIGGAAPPNAGSFRRVRIHLRENCVVGIPRHPASCSVATCNVMDRVANAVQRGLGELGEGYGMGEVSLSFPASVSVISGHDPRNGGMPFIDQIVLGWTGGPAGPDADGWLTMGGVGDAGVLQRDSIELDELRFPLRIDTQRILADSEGAGRRRGAPATLVEFRPVGADVEIMYNSDGTIHPPQGTRGGHAGSHAGQWIRSADGVETAGDICARILVREGETVISRCSSGGGYGDPLEREPERVVKDVREGWVTPARAAAVYGVVLDADLTVVEESTAALRAERRRGRSPASP
jgi:N-methylhydantoinase B